MVFARPGMKPSEARALDKEVGRLWKEVKAARSG